MAKKTGCYWTRLHAIPVPAQGRETNEGSKFPRTMTQFQKLLFPSSLPSTSLSPSTRLAGTSTSSSPVPKVRDTTPHSLSRRDARPPPQVPHCSCHPQRSMTESRDSIPSPTLLLASCLGLTNFPRRALELLVRRFSDPAIEPTTLPTSQPLDPPPGDPTSPHALTRIRRRRIPSASTTPTPFFLRRQARRGRTRKRYRFDPRVDDRHAGFLFEELRDRLEEELQGRVESEEEGWRAEEWLHSMWHPV